MATTEEVARRLTLVSNLSHDLERALTRAFDDLEGSLGGLHLVLTGTGQSHVMEALRGLDHACGQFEDAIGLVARGRQLLHRYSAEAGFLLGTRRPLDLDLPMYSALRLPTKVRQREGAEKPQVADHNLQNIVNELFKGVTKPGRVGDGTTMDAIWNERAGGGPTGGTYHFKKGREAMSALRNWTERNPAATARDRVVARDLYRQLREAMGEDR